MFKTIPIRDINYFCNCCGVFATHEFNTPDKKPPIGWDGESYEASTLFRIRVPNYFNIDGSAPSKHSCEVAECDKRMYELYLKGEYQPPEEEENWFKKVPSLIRWAYFTLWTNEMSYRFELANVSDQPCLLLNVQEGDAFVEDDYDEPSREVFIASGRKLAEKLDTDEKLKKLHGDVLSSTDEKAPPCQYDFDVAIPITEDLTFEDIEAVMDAISECIDY